MNKPKKGAAKKATAKKQPAASAPKPKSEKLLERMLAAADKEAEALAAKENKSDVIAGVDLSNENPEVTNILIDLAQRETMNRSAGFAGEIVEELGRETPLLTNTHRFAGFAVLKSPDVPAVLIEMGYLSNAIDEKNLRQPEYRAKLAHAISRAVERYFLQGQKAKRP